MHQNLFEPFAQEHSGITSMYGGTGLGLAICKNIVDMMDDHIDVRSIVGVGTEFTVDVKLGITEESKTRYLSKQHYDFGELKALVVDDDVIVCEQAVITLKEIGVVSEWVDSGKKAVERALGKQYEEATIVSEDFKFEGKRVLLAEDHPLNVEVATRLLESKGFKVEDDVQKSRAAGMNAHLAKPIEPAIMYQTLYDFIYGKKNLQD